MAKFYFTFDHLEKIWEGADIEYVEAETYEEAHALIMREYEERNGMWKDEVKDWTLEPGEYEDGRALPEYPIYILEI